jgi:serine/threonine protein kinase
MLTDFGVAKILDTDETATLTGTGIGIGTPEYMAPEQWIGQTVLQSDIYSLGVVLYEMITGRKPYVADTPAAILLKLASDPLPKPTQFIPNLPDAVEKILIKALAKKAGDRYPTVTEFVTALERLTYQTEKVNFPKQTTPIERGTFQQRSNVIPDKKPQVALRIPPNVTLVQEPPKNISGRIWIGIGGIGLLVCVITGMLIVLAKMSFPSTYTLTAAPTPTLTAAIAVTATNSKTPIPTWTPFPTKALTSTPLSIPSQPMQTTVSSTTGWQSTDVFIAKGTRINIEVVSGQWTQTKGKVPYNPGLGNQNYSCANYMPANQCVEPLPDAPQGALIGKIGNFIFEIDDGVIITASESGILFLRINDGDVGLYDNDGTLVVRVTLN